MSLPVGPLDLRTQPDVPSTPSGGRSLCIAGDAMEDSDFKDTPKANRVRQFRNEPSPKEERDEAIRQDWWYIDHDREIPHRIEPRLVQLSLLEIRRHVEAIKADIKKSHYRFSAWSDLEPWTESETKFKWNELVATVYKLHHRLLLTMLQEEWQDTLLPDIKEDLGKIRKKQDYLYAISDPPLFASVEINLRAYLKSTTVVRPDTEQSQLETANSSEADLYKTRTVMPPNGYKRRKENGIAMSDASPISSHGVSRLEPEAVGSTSGEQPASTENGVVAAAAGNHTDPDAVWGFYPGGDAIRRSLIALLAEAKDLRGNVRYPLGEVLGTSERSTNCCVLRSQPFKQCITYLKTSNLIDGTIFAMTMRGRSFRMFQYTGPDEISTWIYSKDRDILIERGAAPGADQILTIPYDLAVIAFAEGNGLSSFTVTPRKPMMLGVLAEFLIVVSQAVGRLTRKQQAAPEDMEISERFRYDEPVMQFDASARMERVKITGVSVQAIAPVAVYFKVGEPGEVQGGARSQRITSPPHSDDNASRDTSCPRDPSCDEDMQEGDDD
jgi:hypothetical protein